MRLIVIYKSSPPHVVLGVEPDADLETIRRAFRKLALKYHPDRNKSPDAELKMKEINAAYDAMKNGNYSYDNGAGSNSKRSDDFSNPWTQQENRRDRERYDRGRERNQQNTRNNAYRRTSESWYWDLIDDRLGHFKWEYKGVRKGVRNIVTDEVSDLHFHYTIRKSKDGMYVAKEVNGTSPDDIDRFKSFMNAAKTCAIYARSQHIIRTQGEIPPVVSHKYDKEPQVSTYDHKYIRDWEWRLLERKQPLWMTTLYLDLENPKRNTHTFYIAKFPNKFFYVFDARGRIWLDKKYKTAMNAARACAKSLQKVNLVPTNITHDFENANAAFDTLRLIHDYPELLKERGFSRY